MAKLLTILLIGLVFESIGVVLLKKGLVELPNLPSITLPGIGRLVAQGVTNPHIVLGVFFEALFFVTLLMLMSRAEVSFVWPLTSLSFVFATVAAKVYLQEPVSSARWAGVCLIMMGAALIIWTEKRQESTPAHGHVIASSSGPQPPAQ